jgi:NAD-dependent SIR2 family protein deacetylase
MCHGVVVRRQVDEQGGRLHAELRGKVYGYKPGCAEAFGDATSWAVDRVSQGFLRPPQVLVGAPEDGRNWEEAFEKIKSISMVIISGPKVTGRTIPFSMIDVVCT